MKRPVIWILLFCLLLTLTMSRDALVPERFTGIWYSPDGTGTYQFREGIIRRLHPESSSSLDGAYSFTADSITLFVTDVEELQSVTTLYRVKGADCDLLCTAPNNAETVVFTRNHP